MDNYVTKSQWKHYKGESPYRQAIVPAVGLMVILAALATALL